MGDGDYAKSNGDTLFPAEVNGFAGVLVLEAGENITADDAIYINQND